MLFCSIQNPKDLQFIIILINNFGVELSEDDLNMGSYTAYSGTPLSLFKWKAFENVLSVTDVKITYRLSYSHFVDLSQGLLLDLWPSPLIAICPWGRIFIQTTGLLLNNNNYYHIFGGFVISCIFSAYWKLCILSGSQLTCSITYGSHFFLILCRQT